MPGDRRDLRRQLYAVAAAQSGFFSAAQALDLGYSYQAQKYHADHGNWLRVDRGLFRLPEWPAGLHDELVRWHLWSKHRAIASHDTAAAAHGLGVVNPAKVHLTVPPDFRMDADLLVLHRRQLPPTDVIRLDGAPITTVLRTVLDVIEEHADEELIESVVADALGMGAVTPNRIRNRLDELTPEAQQRAERALQPLEAVAR